jgi:hypothetical protein
MGAIDIARGAAADDKSNLVPRVNLDSVNIGLKPVQGGGKVSVPRS